MANIPTIPGSSQVQTQQIGTKRDVGPQLAALGQLRKTVGAAGSAIDESVGAIADYEERKRKAEEAYVFNSSSLSFQKLHSQFLSNAKKLPDEQIVPDWMQTAQAWKQQQLDQYGSKLSNGAKRMFQMQTDNAIGGTTAKFQVMADHLGSQRRESAAVANFGEFLKSGDKDMANKAVSALSIAVKAGDMTQEKMDFYTSQIPKVLQENQIRNGTESNPVATGEDLKAGKFPNVQGSTRSALILANEREIGTLHRTTQNDIMSRYELDPTNPPSKEEMDSKLKAGSITGDFVKAFGNMQAEKTRQKNAQEKREFDQKEKDDSNILQMQVNNHDWASDTNPEKTAADFGVTASGIVSTGYRKAASELITSKYNQAKKGQIQEERPAIKQQLDFMKQSFEDSVGVIPVVAAKGDDPAKYAKSVKDIERMPDDTFQSAFGEDAKRKDVLETARNYVESEQRRYADAQQKFLAWSKSKEGANATSEQAANERARLGFGRYTSQDDVVSDFKAGKVDRATAKEILSRQFGVQ